VLTSSFQQQRASNQNPIAPSVGPGLYGGIGKPSLHATNSPASTITRATPSTNSSYPRPPSGGGLLRNAAAPAGGLGARAVMPPARAPIMGNGRFGGARPGTGTGTRPIQQQPAGGGGIYYTTANSTYGAAVPGGNRVNYRK
jgi:hypothetical protein